MVRLHPKHGLNPAIPACFFCGQDKNEILLLGNAYKEEAPRHAVFDQTPCPQCKEFMAQGIILVSVRDGETDPNPYRTGRWAVIKDRAIKRILQPSIADILVKTRFGFIPDSVWLELGLPLEDIDNRPKP
jgi:hypothetical protein